MGAPVAWGAAVVSVPFGDDDGREKHSGVAIPPGRATSSVRKFPVASARCRPSEYSQRTL